MTPVDDIDAIVVAPYLNTNFPPDSSIVKFVVTRLDALPAEMDAHEVAVPFVVRNLPLFPVWLGIRALICVSKLAIESRTD
jgi:hypothetical protein